MLSKHLLLILAILLSSSVTAQSPCPGTPSHRLVICDCTGFESDGAGCQGFNGTCSIQTPGNFCGSDPNTGLSCYVATATEQCLSARKELRGIQLADATVASAFKKKQFVFTCGGGSLPDPSNLIYLRKELEL